MAVEIFDKTAIEPFFHRWHEGFTRPCLSGCMGSAFADNAVAPRSTLISIGGFHFLSGAPNPALVAKAREESMGGYAIFVGRDGGWNALIEQLCGDAAAPITRYATRREADAPGAAELGRIADGLKEPYRLRMVDRELYEWSVGSDWARDLCGNFRSYAEYAEYGLGVVAVRDGVPVSGASSYTACRGIIEIEIDTREDERRRGLAFACGARLIQECLRRDIYPGWDAHNRESLALAEKLGYRFAGEYPAYEITGR